MYPTDHPPGECESLKDDGMKTAYYFPFWDGNFSGASCSTLGVY